MNSLTEIIADYLRTNRRLVVPALGTFVVKENGERIFSDLLSVDDGVLNSLLRENGMNEMEAAVSIDRFVFEVRHELEEYGYCRLDEVGTLRIEPETNVLKLYPPVAGSIPEQAPYVPKPIAEDDPAEAVEGATVAEVQTEVAEVATVAEEPIAEVAVTQEEVAVVQEPEKVEQLTVVEQAEKRILKPHSYRPKPKKNFYQKFDLVLVAAVVIAIVALAAIIYGMTI